MEAELSHQLSEQLKMPIIMSVNVLVHDIDTVNRHLSQRHYFFSDIKREGKILYNSGVHKLAMLKKLNPKDRYRDAVENYEYWFEKAASFKSGVEFYLSEGKLNAAAFLLHQATESLYHGILLVFTHYKPKTHDLEELRKKVNSLDPRFLKAFPLVTKEQKRLFTLLRKAYIDARYKKDYRITEGELTILQKQVNDLETIGHTLCQEKIKQIESTIPTV